MVFSKEVSIEIVYILVKQLENLRDVVQSTKLIGISVELVDYKSVFKPA